ncbi:hypothetical protein [Paenibacillus xylanexedens]|uniref:hypothetical protein n=1 Tax=Paenibacillus xylanexedens TaxID=528191 RepID=UPI0011A1CB2C|nr:hypothetical protein [Paenibacillus xylanexedens]
MENTWGLIFTKVNLEENKFDYLLELNTGSEHDTRLLFNRIKNEFTENKGEPEMVIDLVDEEDGIIDDFSLTFSQAETVASLLGHNISM